MVTDVEHRIARRIADVSGWGDDGSGCIAVVVAGGVVSVVSHAVLTEGERHLVGIGGDQALAQLRTEVRQGMREELAGVIEEVLGSPVTGFLTACQGTPGIVVDTFLRDPILPEA